MYNVYMYTVHTVALQYRNFLWEGLDSIIFRKKERKKQNKQNKTKQNSMKIKERTPDCWMFHLVQMRWESLKVCHTFLF